jgi:hypothetical protein
VSITESLDDLGYEHAYSLTLSPDVLYDSEDEESSENDNENEASDTTSAMEVSEDWPSDYPTEQLPVYEKASFEVRTVVEQGGQKMIAIASEEALDVTVEYYQGLLQESVGYSSVVSGSATMIQGTKDGLYIMVIITENDGTLGEDEKFRSLVQIVY